MIKVSVVVPVYNIEAYIGRCLESLLNQDLKEIEIIVVNDGSSDDSPKICKNYARQHVNIKYISQRNQGLSAARNTGINAAKGEYIGFVDGDDFVNTEMFSTLYNNAKVNDVLISCCGCVEYYDNGKTHAQIASGINRKYNRNEALDLFLLERYYGVSACNKIYSKKLFQNVKFPVGRLYEDILTVYKLIDLSGSLYYDSTIQYYYYRRNDSITAEKFNPNTLGIIDAVGEVVEFYQKNIGKPKFLYVGQVLFYLQVLGKMYRAGKNDRRLVSSIKYLISMNWNRIFLTKNVSMRGKAKLFFVWLYPRLYKKIYVVVSRLRDNLRNKEK